MKVYFSGSHSCGKSTLARYVSEKYNLPMISESARTVLSEQELQIDALRCDLNISNKYQKDVFERQISEEKKYDNFVSDRSAIDALSYSAQHSKILAQLMRSDSLQEYLKSIKLPGSFVFFVRPSKATLRADGVRESLNWEGVVAIDAMIKLLFEIFEVKYFQINMDNMQERVTLVNNIINYVQSVPSRE